MLVRMELEWTEIVRSGCYLGRTRDCWVEEGLDEERRGFCDTESEVLRVLVAFSSVPATDEVYFLWW